MGLHDILAALLVLTSLFAFFVSVDQGYQIAKEQPRFIGGALAHAGLAILFLGIIASGRYGQKQSISLPLNQPKSAVRLSIDCTLECRPRRMER